MKSSAGPRTPLRVVIADDHRMFRDGVIALLERDGQIEICASCPDGDSAWEAIQKHKPQLALVDQSMPGRTGIEIAKAIEDAYLPVRVLLLTMRKGAALLETARAHGVLGVVLKDDAFEELTTAIALVAEGKPYVSPVLAAAMLDPADAAGQHLSPREIEVLTLLATGSSNKEIAKLLSISPKTVDNHRTRIMGKLSAHTISDLVRFAIRAGLTEP